MTAPPPEVVRYYQALSNTQANQIDDTAWWQALVGSASKEWEAQPLWSGQRDPALHPFPNHFVMGTLAPFTMRRATHTSGLREIWCVAFSDCTTNGTANQGHGGAIAAVFDFATGKCFHK